MILPCNLLSVVLTVCLLTRAATSFSVNGGGGQQKRIFVSTPVSKYPKHSVVDCMTSNPYTLKPDWPLDDAISNLLSKGLSGAPVVDADQVLVGVVSSYDFLQKEAFEGALLRMEGSVKQVESYVEAAKKICAQKVSDIMSSSDIRTVTPNTSMRKAAALMAAEKLHRLPVVLDDGKLVGILTSSDVMQDLLHVARYLPAGEDGEDHSSAESTEESLTP